MFRITIRRFEIHHLTALLTVFISLVFLSSIGFTKTVRMSLREKVRVSDLIIQGPVTSITSKGSGVKLVELKISEILYGRYEGESVRIIISDEEDEPIYEKGDKVVTFLRSLKVEEYKRLKLAHDLTEEGLGYRTVNKFHGPFYIDNELAEKEGPLWGKKSLVTQRQLAFLKREIKKLLVEFKKIEPKASGLAEQELEYINIGARIDIAIGLNRADVVRLQFALRGGKEDEARTIMQTIRSRADGIINEYKAFLSKYPNSADAHNGLGLIYYETGGVEKALQEWSKAIEIDADHPDANNNLASHYGDCGKEIKAIEELRHAVRINPYKAIYHYNLAVLYDTARYKVANAYGWDLKKIFWESQKEGDLARKLEPTNFEYASSYAMAFVTAKFFGVKDIWDDALKAWQDCLDMNLDNGQKSIVYANIGRVYNYSNNKKKAVEYLRKSLELRSSRLIRALLKKIEGEL